MEDSVCLVRGAFREVVLCWEGPAEGCGGLLGGLVSGCGGPVICLCDVLAHGLGHVRRAGDRAAIRARWCPCQKKPWCPLWWLNEG